jgi:hypothetical protein
LKDKLEPGQDNSKALSEKYEPVVREMITKENELTNQRMLWMAAFNGLLFASLGFSWEKQDTNLLKIVISCLGIAASFLNGLALVFAADAQRRLLQWWHDNTPKNSYKGPGVMGVEPKDKERRSLYFAPWIILSFLFTLGWLAILIFVLGRGK